MDSVHHSSAQKNRLSCKQFFSHLQMKQTFFFPLEMKTNIFFHTDMVNKQFFSIFYSRPPPQLVNGSPLMGKISIPGIKYSINVIYALVNY